MLGFVYALPNIFPPQPAVQISANRGATVDQALKEKVQGILETEKIPFERIELERRPHPRALRRTPTRRSPASDALATRARRNNYTVALNLASTVPRWLRAIGANAMPLGLDLQGGVHFLMEVDESRAAETCSSATPTTSAPRCATRRSATSR